MELERIRTLATDILADWTSQDVGRVLARYTEDLRYTDPNTRGAIRGRAAMARYLERLFSEWTMAWSLREARGLAGEAGAHVLWTGTFRRAEGGLTASIDGMDLVLLDGERIARNDVVFDRSLLPRPTIEPDSAEAHSLALRSWMTHDAMWFRAAVDAVGVERANQMNLRAVHDASEIEARRVMAFLGMTEVTSLRSLERFLGGARRLLVGDLLQAQWTFEAPSTMHIEIRDCFAAKGIERIGLLDRYQCGIYERIWGWFDALGIRHDEQPPGRACTRDANGRCARVVTLAFGPSASREARAPIVTS